MTLGYFGLVALAGVFAAGCAPPDALHSTITYTAPDRRAIVQDAPRGDPREARISQQSGRIVVREPTTTRSELRPNRAGGVPNTSPVSCGQQNATDPACVAASQQGRSIGR